MAKDAVKLIDEKLKVARNQSHLAKQNNNATAKKTADDKIELLQSIKEELKEEPKEETKSTKTTKKSSTKKSK